jgi:TfoX/Sxy family transcriptional regulator of competence genes
MLDAGSPEERYAAICAGFENEPGVTRPSRARKTFGSATLKLHDRIFAMLVRGNLVVKLPAHRVDAMIASGEGHRYEPGPGRLMKEWLSVEPTVAQSTWLALAHEAYEYSKPRK